MKKKMVMLLLVAAMVSANVMPAFAEETAETEAVAVTDEEGEDDEEEEMAEINFEDITPAYEGTWVDFEGGFSLYLPTEWDVWELSDEDKEKNTIFVATAPDETGWNMKMRYKPAGEEEYTLEDLMKEFEGDEDFAGVEIDLINTIPVMIFETTDETAVGMCFMDDLGGLYSTVIIGDLEDEDFSDLALTICASVSITVE